VDSLIDKGMAATTGRPVLGSAIDRIRALSSAVAVPRR
jgi:heme O synthase-like polyprenyltransferase